MGIRVFSGGGGGGGGGGTWGSITGTLSAQTDLDTALNARATKALDNLASVAINTSLISDTANTDDLGSSAIPWRALYVGDNAAGVALTRPSAASARHFLFDGTGGAAGDAFRIHNFAHPTGSSAIPTGYNLFIGAGAGNLTIGSTATTTGHSSNNIGIGRSVLALATTASDNVVIGNLAGDALTTGTNNVAVGAAAGGSLSSSTNNVLIGSSAGGTLSTGTGYNVAVGQAALLNLTNGDYNTAVGMAALNQITTTDNNTAVGRSAGSSLANGSTANTGAATSLYLGALTKSSAASQSNQIVIGYDAIGKGTNTVVIGDDNITQVWISEDAGAQAVTATVGRVDAAATTGASQAGLPVEVKASNAVASTDTAGAAAGGSITLTAGAAARNASGNADAGYYLFTDSAGIGTGVGSQLRIPAGTINYPAISFTADQDTAGTGIYRSAADTLTIVNNGVAALTTQSGYIYAGTVATTNVRIATTNTNSIYMASGTLHISANGGDIAIGKVSDTATGILVSGTTGRLTSQQATLTKWLVEPNTAGVGSPNILTAAESATVLTNEGITAKNYHTLPTAAAGLVFTFIVQDVDGLRITANTDDTIRVIDKVTATAGYIESTTIGSVVTLQAINAVEWYATSIHGVFTDGTFTYDDTGLTTP